MHMKSSRLPTTGGVITFCPGYGLCEGVIQMRSPLVSLTLVLPLAAGLAACEGASASGAR